MRYFALLDGREGAYGVVVPDLPGCTAAGKTVDAAYRNATQAVRLWIDDAIADGEKFPPPRSLIEVFADREVRRALKADAALLLVPAKRR